MPKSYLIIYSLFLQTALFGQVSCKNSIKSDTLSNVIVQHANLKGQSNRDIERGYFKVLKIDTLKTFYLIFIEKNGIKSTIYSEICLSMIGQKISIDSTYYLELTCRDTLSNGKCLPIIPDVSYFNKYKGYELGKLNLTNSLCGLFIINPKESYKFK